MKKQTNKKLTLEELANKYNVPLELYYEPDDLYTYTSEEEVIDTDLADDTYIGVYKLVAIKKVVLPEPETELLNITE